MTTGPRVAVYYDPKIDSEIAKIVAETPKRRQSARFRELIKLGLMVEKKGIGVSSPQDKSLIVSETPITAAEFPQYQRVKKRVGIPAPDQLRP